MCTSPPLLAPRLKIFKFKFTTPPGIEPRTCWTRGRRATIWANAVSCKQQSSVWKSPLSPTPKKKQKWFLLQGKLWSISLFDIDGMVYQHVVPAHTIVTGLYYRDVLKVLQGHIRQKRPCLSATSWMLHHDYARLHVANVVAEYLAQISVKCIPTLLIVRI